ncbi:MAG: hypothetical protein GY953_31645 [bacterium]|nr:hypothetical protein [bacterium]
MVTAVLFVIVFLPSIDAELDLVDDHEILRFSSSTPVHPDLPPSFGPIKSAWDIA